MTGTALAGRRVAVVGAGWAGLAAAVRAVQRGAQVTVIEMAREPGGRARRVLTPAGDTVDNGQHVMIGAYSATLALMQTVGADAAGGLLRLPLSLCQPDGRGLALPAGAPVPAFLRGVLAHRGWRWPDKLALLRAAGGWVLGGFRAAPGQSVGELCAGLPGAVQRELIEPLCLAALNTPMAQASAEVFLRVLKDALFSGRGSADLLLPRVPLSALLPDPAWRWLDAAGARRITGQRVQALQAQAAGRPGDGWPVNGWPVNAWQVDGMPFDAVVLACSATEAARLTGALTGTLTGTLTATRTDALTDTLNGTPSDALAAGWSAQAAALRYEPIVTAYLVDPGLHLPRPMVALPPGPAWPAQFAFDLGALQHDQAARGRFAFVASGAAAALSNGVAACGQLLLQQARAQFPGAFAGPDARVLLHVAAERRATFACSPGLQRPAMAIAPGLLAAGDYVAGPYPATLEGAVRSGLAAADALV